MPHRDEEARRAANRKAQAAHRARRKAAAVAAGGNGGLQPGPGSAKATPRPGGVVGAMANVLGQLPPGAMTALKADMGAEMLELARRIVQKFDPERGTPNDAVRLAQLGVLFLEAARAEQSVQQAEGGPQEFPLVEAAMVDDEGREALVTLMRKAAKHGPRRAS